MYINDIEIKRDSVIMFSTEGKEFVGHVEYIDSNKTVYGTWDENVHAKLDKVNFTLLRTHEGKLTQAGEIYNKTHPQNRI